jgi:hypothetical protein
LSLPEHIECNIGPIDGGWIWRGAVDFSVIRILNRPLFGENTICTLGFSDKVLAMPDSKSIRQEFLLIADKEFEEEKIANFIIKFAASIADSKCALLRGEVFGPHSSIIDDSTLNCIYSTIPMHYGDTFQVYRDTDPPTVFVLLVPVTESEADFIRKFGWNKFEDLAEVRGLDIGNLRRDSIL